MSDNKNKNLEENIIEENNDINKEVEIKTNEDNNNNNNNEVKENQAEDNTVKNNEELSYDDIVEDNKSDDIVEDSKKDVDNDEDFNTKLDNYIKAYEESNNINNDESKKGKSVILKSVIASGITSLIVSIGAVSVLNNMSDNNMSSQITIENKTVDNVYKAVAQKATPSVVGITTLSINTNNFFNLPMESEGVGSGVIVNKDGYILTNSHVVDDGKAAKVSVLFSDASSVDGRVIWNDAKLDLAIIKVDNKEGLQVADLGDSSKTEVGDIAIAIGNPLGLEFNKTVTQGIVSGLNRTINTVNGEMTDLIQTDASINPGNSGGPLFNDKGEVIGINTAKASNAEGLGFAIPINIAKTIIEQVISEGDFQKVTLGIKGFDTSEFDMSVDKGVYVVEVEENSAAKRAGISSGNIIVKVDDKDITNMSDLTKALYTYKNGDVAKVTVLKDNEEVELEVKF